MKITALSNRVWAAAALLAVALLTAGGPVPNADSILLRLASNADPAVSQPAALIRGRLADAEGLFQKSKFGAGIDSLRLALQPALKLRDVAPVAQKLADFEKKLPPDSLLLRARCEQFVGYLWQQKGLDHLAFPHYSLAADLFSNTSDDRNAARSLQNLANILGDWGDHQQKLDLLERALEKARASRDSETVVRIHNNRATTWLESLDNPDSAIVDYQKAIDVFGADRTGRPTVFTARCFFYKGDLKNCRLWLDRLQKTPGSLDDEQVRGYAELTRAELAASAGDLKTARRFFETELARLDAAGDKLDAARMAFHLAELEMRAGSPQKAADIFQKAVDSLKIDAARPQLLLDNWTADILFAQADALSKTGDLRGSVAASVRGLGVLGEMRRRAVSDQSKLRLADRQRAGCERAMPNVHELFEKNPGDTMAVRGLLAVVGYAKSSALFDGAQRAFAQVFARMPREFQSSERQSLGALAGFERRLLDERDPSERKKLADSTALHRRLLAELEARMEKESPIYRSLKQFDYPLNCPLGVVQSSLDTGQVVVDYLLSGDSVLFTTAFGCDALKSWETPLPAGFAESCAALRRSTADGSWSADSAQTAFLNNAPILFDLLVKPVREAFPSVKRLQFAADGPLNFLPFSALLTRPHGGSWTDRELPVLCREAAVSMAWSAVFPADFFKRSGGASLEFGGFGADYRDRETWLSMRGKDNFSIENNKQTRLALAFRGGDLDSLPNADDEVDAISAFFGKQETWLNRDCTKDNFERNAGRCGILHIALHGSPLRDDGAEFGLLFSKNEQVKSNILTAADVARLDLRAGLVVVSSCESALGELRRGEGVLSLGRAFALSGCPAAVVNLWKADDFSSKSIMVAFYEGLRAGLPKDVALQRAWLTYLSDASSLGARPGFWANFELVGDVAPIGTGGGMPLSAKIWMAVGAAVITAVAWLFFKKKD